MALQVDEAAEAYEKAGADGVPFTLGPELIPVIGRTTVELRDPDGWRNQLIDKTRAEPEPE